MPGMKPIAYVLSIIALGVGLLSCSGGGGGGGGSSTPAFAISTTAADFGVVGNAYTSTLVTTGGTAPFSWMLFVGALPTGLTLNPGTGVVSGTPTTAGNVTATFTVTDSTGKTATGSVLFSIHTRTDRVSVDGNGAAGDGASSRPSINSDGSLVAFVSLATNLLAPGTPAVAGQQVYVHNRQTNQIELVSRDNSVSVVNEGNGASSASVISSDGRYVVFVSQATNLLAPGTPAVPAGQQIYIRDRQLGQSSLVSQDNTNTNIEGAGGASDTPSINSDGGFVAFFSQATNLVAGSGAHIYVRAVP